MLYEDFKKYLNELPSSFIFKVTIESSGGYITFSNSGQRGGRKYFNISLLSIKNTLEDILDNYSFFQNETTYVEKNWRDLSQYYSDKTMKSIATVQTKPLFTTFSKIINWANHNQTTDESLIDLKRESINNAIKKLNQLILFFTPQVLDMQKIIKFSDEQKGNLNFQYKNILFKGVPGTGKSRAIDTIIKNELEIKDEKKNILRVNIHSASSNSDLMQGIGISTSLNGTIKYSEKQGLILDIIKRATFKPNQPFVLILEEIQENSLNELIGDLIYLIEEDKRAKNIETDNQEYTYEELVNKLIEENSDISYIEIPFLVNDSTDYKKMIMPNNLFIFCTSNYRDDKKVIEDNLLRRFEVIEIYPNDDVPNEYVKEFFSSLNSSILEKMKDNHETHPDRFMIGHSIWRNVANTKTFYKAFSKLITEFKDIREVEFDIFKEIIQDSKIPEDVNIEIDTKQSYYELIKDIQLKIDYGFIS